MPVIVVWLPHLGDNNVLVNFRFKACRYSFDHDRLMIRRLADDVITGMFAPGQWTAVTGAPEAEPDDR